MKCEYCNLDHDGTYGSGRFCKKTCATGFSTQSKRKEINEAVSLKAKSRGMISTKHLQTKASREKRTQTMIAKYGRTGFPEHARILGLEKSREIRAKRIQNTPFNLLSNPLKKRFLLAELGRKCFLCFKEEWMGEPIPIELDHIDGNHSNNEKSNFRLLCPNCHALTPTYKSKNRRRG